MRLKKFANLSFLLLVLACSCKKNSTQTVTPLFDSLPVSHALSPAIINEASGIADSKVNPGYLWVEEDSGNPTQLYLLKHDGSVAKKIFLKGITNRDWEDIALFNNEIYLGDIGDNAQAWPDYRIYHFPEPASSVDTVRTIDSIRYSYPDGSHDAEAFFIDPSSKNIYLITKRDNPSKVYRLSFPYGSMNLLSYVGSLPYSGVVGAAISEDRKELLIKTYVGIAYYQLTQGQAIEQALQNSFRLLPYQVEPQGEAVTFAADGTGFYTLSENPFNTAVNLYFYHRK